MSFFRCTEVNSAEHLQELQAKVAELEQSVAEKTAEIAKLQTDKAGLEVVLERERKNSISSMSSDCKKVSSLLHTNICTCRPISMCILTTQSIQKLQRKTYPSLFLLGVPVPQLNFNQGLESWYIPNRSSASVGSSFPHTTTQKLE